ncbi:MAG: hypothetical protein IRZ16_01260 [Myxococcaceae bacterium]|nr:hypothetical protein [Myxococcaceae bacterium]
MSTDPNAQAPRPFFSIYRPERRRGTPLRTRLLVIGGAFALALMAQWIWPDPQTYRIVTPKGLRAVHAGMSVRQVEAALGVPIGTEANGSLQCYRYGSPTFEAPSFLVHVACFEDGKLKSLTSKRYTAERIDPGALPRPPSGG